MAKERFHIGKIRIGDWWAGIHFERFFENLLKQKTPDGKILLQPAASKAADGLDQILIQWSVVEPVFDSVVSDEGQASADKVKELVEQIRDDLRQVETADDIPVLLEDYDFSPNEAKDKFYHEFVSIVFVAFSDGDLSPIELIPIANRLLIYIKEGK